jgi:hypothetical protein
MDEHFRVNKERVFMWVIYDSAHCTWYANARRPCRRVYFYPTILFMDQRDEIFLPHSKIAHVGDGKVTNGAKHLLPFTLRGEIRARFDRRAILAGNVSIHGTRVIHKSASCPKHL